MNKRIVTELCLKEQGRCSLKIDVQMNAVAAGVRDKKSVLYLNNQLV